MSQPDFKDQFKKLLEIDQNLVRLRREEKLRNRLKVIGVGYLFYKNVDSEIEENLSRRKILLENFDSSVVVYINSLRNGIQNIRTSNVYLSQKGVALWLNRIEESKREISYLKSGSVLGKSQANGLLAELDGSHQFVRTYNVELEKSARAEI